MIRVKWTPDQWSRKRQAWYRNNGESFVAMMPLYRTAPDINFNIRKKSCAIHHTNDRCWRKRR